MKMSGLDLVTFALVVVGGLNWGLVGFFNYNLVESLIGVGTLTTVIYDLVGLSALYMAFMGVKKS